MSGIWHCIVVKQLIIRIHTTRGHVMELYTIKAGVSDINFMCSSFLSRSKYSQFQDVYRYTYIAPRMGSLKHDRHCPTSIRLTGELWMNKDW